MCGQDAITDTTKYWKNELKKQRKAAPKAEPTPTTKTTVVPKKTETATTKASLGSAWDNYL